MRWRDFTFPMRFAFRASTIRTCSLRTFRSHAPREWCAMSLVWLKMHTRLSPRSLVVSSFYASFYTSFRSELPDGSLPTFVWDNVTIPIPTITEGRLLSPSSFTYKPFGRSCDRLTFSCEMRRPIGLPCSVQVTSPDLEPISPPVERHPCSHYQNITNLSTCLLAWLFNIREPILCYDGW